MIYHKIDCNTSIECYEAVEGETIEMKVERMLSNNEPIDDTAPLIYTDRRDGVMPAYDIRTDRFEIGLDATDYITRSKLAQREDYYKKLDEASNPETGANTSDINQTEN